MFVCPHQDAAEQDFGSYSFDKLLPLACCHWYDTISMLPLVLTRWGRQLSSKEAVESKQILRQLGKHHRAAGLEASLEVNRVQPIFA